MQTHNVNGYAAATFDHFGIRQPVRLGNKYFVAGVDCCEYRVEINGVSKSYAMTGWRLGYLACPENVAKAISSFQSHSTSNVNTMTQYAAIAALNGDQKPMNEMVKAFGKRRKVMLDKLEKMKSLGIDYVKPDGAFYVMLLCDNLISSSERAYERRRQSSSPKQTPGVAATFL